MSMDPKTWGWFDGFKAVAFWGWVEAGGAKHIVFIFGNLGQSYLDNVQLRLS